MDSNTLQNLNIKNFLPQNLRFLRKKFQLSQEELAAQAGLNRGNIASYENGGAEPRICNLLKFSMIFKTPISDLTSRDLSCHPTTLNGASHPVSSVSKREKEFIEEFEIKSKEIKDLFNSLYYCCQFKSKTVGDLSKDAQILLGNFEQLHDAAKELLCAYNSLLSFVKEKI